MGNTPMDDFNIAWAATPRIGENKMAYCAGAHCAWFWPLDEGAQCTAIADDAPAEGAICDAWMRALIACLDDEEVGDV